MKTMKILTYAVFVLFLGLAISSCKGDDGADGIDGTTGPAGADGIDGIDGNANVIYSDWLAFDLTDWGDFFTEYSIGTRLYEINASELTQEIVDYGAVLVYAEFGGTVYALPLTHSITGGLQNLSYFYSTASITLRMINHDGVGDPGTISSGSSYKYILIEGSTQIGKSAEDSQQEVYTELKNAGIDINDYYEVCDYYGINPK